MNTHYRPEQYRYTVFWSEPDTAYIGTVNEFPSLSVVADTLEAALREIKIVVAEVLTDMAEAGETPPVPLSASTSIEERRSA
jgi:predicted RNase H-like HicB family nuclease